MRIDHETVLNMWARGESSDAIAAAVGEWPVNIPNIVARHRALGDVRAVHRERGTQYRDKGRADMSFNVKRFHFRRRIKDLPVDAVQISAAIAAYTGNVTLCPPAVHLGYRPKCLDLLENT